MPRYPDLPSDLVARVDASDLTVLLDLFETISAMPAVVYLASDAAA
ncbi:MAG: hypothetical protein R3D70_12255 [Rhizobiaceae bacterium]